MTADIMISTITKRAFCDSIFDLHIYELSDYASYKEHGQKIDTQTEHY